MKKSYKFAILTVCFGLLTQTAMANTTEGVSSPLENEQFETNIEFVEASSEPQETHQIIVVASSKDEFSALATKMQDPEYVAKMNEVLLTSAEDTLASQGIRNLLSLPTKAVLWNRKVNSGALNELDELKLRSYIVDAGITDTAFSINEYQPGMVWSRTWENDNISFLSKLTFGSINALAYTTGFKKVLGGGDHYNPFANLVVLYSDDLNIALHEAGHAKDFSNWQWKDPTGIFYDGSMVYILLGAFPPVLLWQEFIASRIATNRIYETEGPEAQYEVHRVLAPAFGTYISAILLASLVKIKPSKWTRKKKSVQIRNSKKGKKALQISLRGNAKRRTALFLGTLVAGHAIGRIVGHITKKNKEKEIKELENAWDKEDQTEESLHD